MTTTVYDPAFSPRPRRGLHVLRRPLSRTAAAIAALSALAAVAAFVGGAALVLRPDGGALGFPPALLSGTPFDSFLIPGVLLLLLGALQAAAIAAVVRWHDEAWPVPFVAGMGLSGFTAVQVALIGPVSLLQGVVFVLGWAIAALSFGLSLDQTARADDYGRLAPGF